MSITAKCNSCAAQFKVKSEWAGKKVKCPKCSKPFQIPSVAKKQAAGSSPIGNAEDPFRLAPETQRAHNPMLDLLDDAGIESTPRGPVCNNCGSELSPMAIICVDCGYNNETGKQLETTTYREKGAIDDGMSDAEKILAKAEKEIDETPMSAMDQNFGDGADSIFIAVAALVIAGVLIAIGVGVVFVMDEIGEEIDTALISFFGSISIYLFCVVWITFIAFRAKPIHGLACILTAGVYSIIFGFMQGRSLMGPAIGCVAGLLIGVVSYLVYASGAG